MQGPGLQNPTKYGHNPTCPEWFPAAWKKTDKNLPEHGKNEDAFFDGRWEKTWIRTRKPGRDPGAPGKHPGVPGIFEKAYPGEAYLERA